MHLINPAGLPWLVPAGINTNHAVLRSTSIVSSVDACPAQRRLEMGCQARTPSFDCAEEGYQSNHHRQL